ncbi:type II toxin-antitoxin system VapC family toxin [Nostoc sp. 'Lobaria pulmonaria (5183) cyanobiont']|uniref:type II toxin-antitoxin system VapC family toxin n=1 Tax=Nostoc sp. 'Lobaria pulmonaria (5183) cyanobiont' TaxID=1618022 RepID=UPI000CF34269|nr:PIN domain-containing protein [Nostoc sp. 'Lobaria pulmonaria (5183) cyanobiont']AVH69257.1 PIN domain protein [Nostoc sp. 'Lobaria pulmonaria (5183) cyanobiont']
MRKKVLLDTGPLVAFINNRENSHDWAVNEWKKIKPPLLTCEVVISETFFILRDFYGGQDAVMSLLDTRIIQISFRLSDEIGTVRELLKRYQNVPMSLADACLVRMSELINGSSVLTLDSDFRVYRKNKNEMIDLIIADGI